MFSIIWFASNISRLPIRILSIRQEALLRYIHGYRQQLMRLVTIVGWLQRRPGSANNVAYSRLLLNTTTRHQGILQETADKLFYLWRDELQVCSFCI